MWSSLVRERVVDNVGKETKEILNKEAPVVNDLSESSIIENESGK